CARDPRWQLELLFFDYW
nr:immunoglobulin heavy chain junction region [Macaca mulatta]MOX60558.1 immunoglobulin heavy chain junction region [Macaca mulatta]MOX62185.1 immunoglobulin heavy chain junction region [Macaca mulatta]MOX62315.1 immunoglobulin heavy chain junction region [Macaca mulatta]MOX62638.1 immunoglobulin heavy chain junction region [Macaca mulatta]